MGAVYPRLDENKTLIILIFNFRRFVGNVVQVYASLPTRYRGMIYLNE